MATVAIIDVDSIGFDPEWTQRIISAIAGSPGLPRGNIRLSCTHTHSGPNTFRLPVITEGRDMILEYLEALPLKISGAVWQAQQNLRPVRIGAASGACDININRRLRLPGGRVVIGPNPKGPVDQTVRVVRIDGLDEKPVATIVHYACHPTTIAWQSQYKTPDYPGMAKRVVEEQIGGTCLFLQGATGNVGPKRGFTGDMGVYRKARKTARPGSFENRARHRDAPAAGETRRTSGIGRNNRALFEYDAAHRSQPSGCTVPFRAASLEAVPIARKQRKPRPPHYGKSLTGYGAMGMRRDTRGDRDGDAGRGMLAGPSVARLYHGKTHIDWQLQGIRIGPVA